MGWLDHDRLGFNYRLSDIACALGFGSAGAIGLDARGHGTGCGVLSEALGELRVSGCPAPTAGARGGVVRVRRAAARGVDRDADDRALAAEQIQSKPLSAGFHLMSFYREALRPPVRVRSRSARTLPRAPSRCRSFSGDERGPRRAGGRAAACGAVRLIARVPLP